LTLPSSWQGLQIWLDDSRHTADFSETPDLRNRSFPLTNALSEPFESNVESDLVSELEAIRDGFRRRVDHHGDALYPVLRTPLGKRGAGEANHPQLSVVEPWSPTASRKGHPDLTGKLGRNAMEYERGEQTHRAIRQSLCHLRQRVVLSDWGIRHSIETPPCSFHNAAAQKPQEVFSRDACGFDVTWAQDAMMLGQSRNPRLNRVLQYVIILLNLNTFCNLSGALASVPNTVHLVSS
jgi:hypothetical protein